MLQITYKCPHQMLKTPTTKFMEECMPLHCSLWFTAVLHTNNKTSTKI